MSSNPIGIAPEEASAEGAVTEASESVLQLVREEIPRLRRYARVLVKDADRADDLVQECLARALKGLHRWQVGTSMRAWLFTIIHRIYLNEQRRPPTAYLEDVDLSESLQSVPGRQEHAVELRELQHAFNRLSSEHKQILMLVAIDGLKYEEAAEILDVEIGTVRSRLFRARAALARFLNGPPAN